MLTKSRLFSIAFLAMLDSTGVKLQSKLMKMNIIRILI